jgi:ATP-dependent 26S proteasome regulatory subunit
MVGLCVSEAEVDSILRSPLVGANTDALPNAGDTESPSADPPTGGVSKGDNGRSSQVGATHPRRLACRFGLSPFEVDALLMCLLPELDLKCQTLFAYLQDDVTKRSPSVDLLLRLLCDSFEQRLVARRAFLPGSPLMKNLLLHMQDDGSPGEAPLPARCLRIDERMASSLLGVDEIDSRLQPTSRLVPPEKRLDDIILAQDTRMRLEGLAGRHRIDGMVAYFRGGSGVGKRTTAGGVCKELSVPLLVVEVSRMAADGDAETLVRLAFREALLQGAAVYLDGFDVLLGDAGGVRPIFEVAMRLTREYPGWIFLSGETRWEPAGNLKGKPFISVDFPLPSYEARERLWQIGESGLQLAEDVDFGEVAGRFRLSGGQILDAAALANSLALWRDPQEGLVTAEDLYAACRRQSRHRLDTLARRILPRYHWDDIILPRDQMRQLREICSHVRHHHTVYGNWGFGRKLSLGKGLNVLFAGPSGTGKTMAAEVIATALGLDLYRIDLSAIVSKYIGETEKNLDRVFHEGKTSNAILFFDEADALFGKRSEVRDSHDRYANIEIAYLLQKMEEYDGLVILATNMRKNMDDAFARRMHFAVEFPVPDESDRCRIWQGVFPEEMPLAADADLGFMARQFKTSGGNIKNIALAAAFMAAEDGGRITTENLIRATRREYQKLGRLCTEGEFGRYFKLARD